MGPSALLQCLEAHIVAERAFIGRVQEAPWVNDFKAKYPRRIPESLLSVIQRLRFDSFACGAVLFYSNTGAEVDGDILVEPFRDAVLFSGAVKEGFLPFARPTTGSYDPVCFDARGSTKLREYPVVRLDHEAILLNGKAVVTETYAASLSELVQRGVAA